MATPEPATAQVLAMLEDHELRLKVLFMRDGVICPDEQAVMDDVREDMKPIAEEANLGRELMISFGNLGRITPWQARKVREYGRDHGVEVIDLGAYRSTRNAETPA